MTRNLRIKEQLGMSSGKAVYTLQKDILFSLVKDIPCYRCGLPLTRETFSIDHKENWLNSDTPRELFFDLENISFSHMKCNADPKHKTPKALKGCGTHASYKRGCRCDECIEGYKLYNQEYNKKRNAEYQHDPVERNKRYKKYKC